jgi:hypothetical protein
MTVGDQPITKVGTEKPGAAGDENAHWRKC